MAFFIPTFVIEKLTLKSLQKTLSVAMALIFFSQVALGSVSESNFWGERRRTLDKSKQDVTDQSRFLAQLPQSLILQRPLSKFNPETNPQDQIHLFKKSQSLNSLPQLSNLISPFGQIKDIYRSPHSGSPEVIQIQDLHEIEEAQRNSAAIIEQLGGKYGVRFVGLEGAQGPFNLAPYRAYPNHEITKSIAAYFLRTGYIGGAEYVGITAPKPPTLWGLENLLLYERNIRDFKDSTLHKKSLESDLEKLRSISKDLKEKIFSKELLNFDRQLTVYQNQSEGLGSYVEYLLSLLTSNRSHFSNLQLFSDALRMEKSIDFKSVERERLEFLRAITSRIPEIQLAELAQKSSLFRSGHMTYLEYDRYLQNLCHQNQIACEKFKQLNAYRDYQLIAECIDQERLFKELSEAEEAAQNFLARDPNQKDLVVANRDLLLVEKLLGNNMTTLDWANYERNKDRIYNTPNTLRRLASGRSASRHSFEDFTKSLEIFERFYRVATQRNEALVQNLLDKMQKDKVSTAVLVAGGFHTEGLTKLLKQKKASYVVVTPKITEVPKESHYLDVFVRDPLPLEKLFHGDIINLIAPRITASHLPSLDKSARQEIVESLMASLEPLLQIGLEERDVTKIFKILEESGQLAKSFSSVEDLKVELEKGMDAPGRHRVLRFTIRRGARETTYRILLSENLEASKAQLKKKGLVDGDAIPGGEIRLEYENLSAQVYRVVSIKDSFVRPFNHLRALFARRSDRKQEIPKDDLHYEVKAPAKEWAGFLGLPTTFLLLTNSHDAVTWLGLVGIIGVLGFTLLHTLLLDLRNPDLNRKKKLRNLAVRFGVSLGLTFLFLAPIVISIHLWPDLIWVRVLGTGIGSVAQLYSHSVWNSIARRHGWPLLSLTTAPLTGPPEMLQKQQLLNRQIMEELALDQTQMKRLIKAQNKFERSLLRRFPAAAQNIFSLRTQQRFSQGLLHAVRVLKSQPSYHEAARDGEGKFIADQTILQMSLHYVLEQYYGDLTGNTLYDMYVDRTIQPNNVTDWLDEVTKFFRDAPAGVAEAYRPPRNIIWTLLGTKNLNAADPYVAMISRAFATNEPVLFNEEIGADKQLMTRLFDVARSINAELSVMWSHPFSEENQLIGHRVPKDNSDTLVFGQGELLRQIRKAQHEWNLAQKENRLPRKFVLLIKNVEAMDPEVRTQLQEILRIGELSHPELGIVRLPDNFQIMMTKREGANLEDDSFYDRVIVKKVPAPSGWQLPAILDFPTDVNEANVRDHLKIIHRNHDGVTHIILSLPGGTDIELDPHLFSSTTQDTLEKDIFQKTGLVLDFDTVRMLSAMEKTVQQKKTILRIEGPTGVGKTFTSGAYAKLRGSTFLANPVSEGTELSEFIGGFEQQENSSFHFNGETTVKKRLEEGGVVALSELNTLLDQSENVSLAWWLVQIAEAEPDADGYKTIRLTEVPVPEGKEPPVIRIHPRALIVVDTNPKEASGTPATSDENASGYAARGSFPEIFMAGVPVLQVDAFAALPSTVEISPAKESRHPRIELFTRTFLKYSPASSKGVLSDATVNEVTRKVTKTILGLLAAYRRKTLTLSSPLVFSARDLHRIVQDIHDALDQNLTVDEAIAEAIGDHLVERGDTKKSQEDAASLAFSHLTENNSPFPSLDNPLLKRLRPKFSLSAFLGRQSLQKHRPVHVFVSPHANVRWGLKEFETDHPSVQMKIIPVHTEMDRFILEGGLVPTDDGTRQEFGHGILGRLIQEASAHPDKQIVYVLENAHNLKPETAVALNEILQDGKLYLKGRDTRLIMPSNAHLVLVSRERVTWSPAEQSRYVVYCYQQDEEYRKSVIQRLLYPLLRQRGIPDASIDNIATVLLRLHDRFLLSFVTNPERRIRFSNAKFEQWIRLIAECLSRIPTGDLTAFIIARSITSVFGNDIPPAQRQSISNFVTQEVRNRFSNSILLEPQGEEHRKALISEILIPVLKNRDVPDSLSSDVTAHLLEAYAEFLKRMTNQEEKLRSPQATFENWLRTLTDAIDQIPKGELTNANLSELIVKAFSHCFQQCLTPDPGQSIEIAIKNILTSPLSKVLWYEPREGDVNDDVEFNRRLVRLKRLHEHESNKTGVAQQIYRLINSYRGGLSWQERDRHKLQKGDIGKVIYPTGFGLFLGDKFPILILIPFFAAPSLHAFILTSSWWALLVSLVSTFTFIGLISKYESNIDKNNAGLFVFILLEGLIGVSALTSIIFGIKLSIAVTLSSYAILAIGYFVLSISIEEVSSNIGDKLNDLAERFFSREVQFIVEGNDWVRDIKTGQILNQRHFVNSPTTISNVGRGAVLADQIGELSAICAEGGATRWSVLHKLGEAVNYTLANPSPSEYQWIATKKEDLKGGDVLVPHAVVPGRNVAGPFLLDDAMTLVDLAEGANNSVRVRREALPGEVFVLTFDKSSTPVFPVVPPFKPRYGNKPFVFMVNAQGNIVLNYSGEIYATRHKLTDEGDIYLRTTPFNGQDYLPLDLKHIQHPYKSGKSCLVERDLLMTTPSLNDVEKSVLEAFGNRWSVDLEGKPGAGKTSIAKETALLLGLPRTVFQMHGERELSDWIGTYREDANGRIILTSRSMSNGRYRSPLLDYLVYGGVFVTDEGAIGERGRDLMSWLSPVVHGDQKIFIEEFPGRVIELTVHPDFHLVITNNAPEDTDARHALKSEIASNVHFVDVPEDDSPTVLLELFKYFLGDKTGLAPDRIDQCGRMTVAVHELLKSDLGKTVGKSNQDRFYISKREIRRVAALLESGLRRGLSSEVALHVALRVVYENMFPNQQDRVFVLNLIQQILKPTEPLINPFAQTTFTDNEAWACYSTDSLFQQDEPVLLIAESGARTSDIVSRVVRHRQAQIEIVDAIPEHTELEMLGGLFPRLGTRGPHETRSRFVKGAITKYLMTEDQLSNLHKTGRVPKETVVWIRNIDQWPEELRTALNGFLEDGFIDIEEEEGKIVQYRKPPHVHFIAEIPSDSTQPFSSAFFNRWVKIGVSRETPSTFPNESLVSFRSIREAKVKALESAQQEFSRVKEWTSDVLDSRRVTAAQKVHDEQSRLDQIDETIRGCFTGSDLFAVLSKAYKLDQLTSYYLTVIAHSLMNFDESRRWSSRGSYGIGSDIIYAVADAYSLSCRESSEWRELEESILEKRYDPRNEWAQGPPSDPEKRAVWDAYQRLVQRHLTTELQRVLGVRLNRRRVNNQLSDIERFDEILKIVFGQTHIPPSDTPLYFDEDTGILERAGTTPVHHTKDAKPFLAIPTARRLTLNDEITRIIGTMARASSLNRVVAIPGETGAAKTSVAAFFAELTGRRFYKYQTHAGSAYTDLTIDLEQLETGEFRKWVKGFYRHLREGHAVIDLDEANISPKLLWILEPLLRGETRVTPIFPDEEPFDIGPDVLVVMTYNPTRYSGRFDIANRILERCILALMDTPQEEDQERIIEGFYGIWGLEQPVSREIPAPTEVRPSEPASPKEGRPVIAVEATQLVGKRTGIDLEMREGVETFDPSKPIAPTRPQRGQVKAYGVFDPDLFPYTRYNSYATYNERTEEWVRKDDPTQVFDVPSLPPDQVEAERRNKERTHDVFKGELKMNLADGSWHTLPSAGADMEIFSVSAIDPSGRPVDVGLQLGRDAADNYFIKASRYYLARDITIIYHMAVPYQYFGHDIPSLIPFRFPANIPPEVQEALKEIEKDTGLTMGESDFRQVVHKLAHYFRNFSLQTNGISTSHGSKYLNIIHSRCGVCRHRAFAFARTAQALGIRARYVTTDIHAFAEIYVENLGWIRIELGGGGDPMSMDLATLAYQRHRSRRDDGLPQPENYLNSARAYADRMAQALSSQGIRPPSRGHQNPPDQATPAVPPAASGGPSFVTNDLRILEELEKFDKQIDHDVRLNDDVAALFQDGQGKTEFVFHRMWRALQAKPRIIEKLVRTGLRVHPLSMMLKRAKQFIKKQKIPKLQNTATGIVWDISGSMHGFKKQLSYAIATVGTQFWRLRESAPQHFRYNLSLFHDVCTTYINQSDRLSESQNEKIIKQMSNDISKGIGTNILRAMQKQYEEIMNNRESRTAKVKYVILFTDGADSHSIFSSKFTEEMQKEMDKYREAGIEVFAIGFGFGARDVTAFNQPGQHFVQIPSDRPYDIAESISKIGEGMILGTKSFPQGDITNVLGLAVQESAPGALGFWTKIGLRTPWLIGFVEGCIVAVGMTLWIVFLGPQLNLFDLNHLFLIGLQLLPLAALYYKMPSLLKKAHEKWGIVYRDLQSGRINVEKNNPRLAIHASRTMMRSFYWSLLVIGTQFLPSEMLVPFLVLVILASGIDHAIKNKRSENIIVASSNLSANFLGGPASSKTIRFTEISINFAEVQREALQKRENARQVQERLRDFFESRGANVANSGRSKQIQDEDWVGLKDWLGSVAVANNKKNGIENAEVLMKGDLQTRRPLALELTSNLLQGKVKNQTDQGVLNKLLVYSNSIEGSDEIPGQLPVVVDQSLTESELTDRLALLHPQLQNLKRHVVVIEKQHIFDQRLGKNSIEKLTAQLIQRGISAEGGIDLFILNRNEWTDPDRQGWIRLLVILTEELVYDATFKKSDDIRQLMFIRIQA